MKTILTIEQSAELIKRGVTLNENDSEVFDIGELLSLLPKRICHDNTLFTLDIHANSVGWQTLYFNPDADINIGWACAAELIDSLYETLCFIIDHNHVKLD